MLAIVTCLVVTILSFLLDFIKTPQASLLLVLNSSDKGIEKKLLPVLESLQKGYKIRSRNVTAGGMDYVVELKTRQNGAHRCLFRNGGYGFSFPFLPMTEISAINKSFPGEKVLITPPPGILPKK